MIPLKSKTLGILSKKASECNVDIDKYLENIDNNYCLIQNGGELIHWKTDKNDYVVYADADEAVHDAAECDKVITEREAINTINKQF